MKVAVFAAKGVGLAAPQVGVSKALFIVLNKSGEYYEVINPEIIKQTNPTIMEEGCLSAPGIYLPIERSGQVHIKYYNVKGEEKSLITNGLEARIILHEYEHLQGEFYFDRVSKSKRRIALGALKRIK